MILRHRRAGVLAVALLAGCGPSATTAPPAERPVAQAQVEILSLPSSFPDPTYDATCQLGALLRFSAAGSHDPAGQALTYEWTETVDGLPSADFGPTGAIRTAEPEVRWVLSTPGAHDIRLTVEARDGRKATATVRVLVTGCEC